MDNKESAHNSLKKKEKDKITIGNKVIKEYGEHIQCKLCIPERCIYGNSDCIIRTNINRITGKTVEKPKDYIFKTLCNSTVDEYKKNKKHEDNSCSVENISEYSNHNFNQNKGLQNYEYFLHPDEWDEFIYDNPEQICETFDRKDLYDWYTSLSKDEREFIYHYGIKEIPIKTLSKIRNVSTSYLYKYRDKLRKSLLRSLSDFSFIFKHNTKNTIDNLDEEVLIDNANEYLAFLHENELKRKTISEENKYLNINW